MKCAKVIDKALSLDRDEKLPLLMKIHVLHCKSCQKEIAEMKAIFAKLKKTSLPEYNPNLTSAIMLQVNTMKTRPHLHGFTPLWGIATFFMVVGAALLAFSENLRTLNTINGEIIFLSIFLSLGIFISAFVAVYIGTHLEKIQKSTDNIMNRRRKKAAH